MSPIDATVVKNVARGAEISRRTSDRAVWGWVRIVGFGIFLIIVFIYILEKATGLPVYTVLGLANCGDPSSDSSLSATLRAQCESREAAYTPTQRNMARLVVAGIVLVVVGFLYSVFRDGPASGLIGPMSAFAPSSTNPRQTIRASAGMQIANVQHGLAQGNDILRRGDAHMHGNLVGMTSNANVPNSTNTMVNASAAVAPTSASVNTTLPTSVYTTSPVSVKAALAPQAPAPNVQEHYDQFIREKGPLSLGIQ